MLSSTSLTSPTAAVPAQELALATLRTASATSSPADFDFLMGKWTIHNRKLKTRLNGCTEWVEFDATQEAGKVLAETANLDQFHAAPGGVPYDGMAVRLFNAKTRLWSIYWTSSNAGTFDVPQVGSFAGPIGLFYAADTFQGRAILVLFKWDATDPNRPVWSQAFSTDEGKTWEWNWYMHLRRPDAPAGN